MPSTLTRDDFRRLIELLADHPAFQTESLRVKLVQEAFAVLPRGAAVRSGLDLGGTTRSAAVDLLSRLDHFGCLGDRHALAWVLETLRPGSGDDAIRELDRFIARLDAPCPPAAPAAMPGRGDGAILHLSDLHFGTLADARNAFSQLAEDLQGELGCTRLDGLICSGDLTQRASADEFAAAVEFLRRMAGEFGLAPERILLVPGNHDLDWSLSRAAYDPGERADYEAADAAGRRRWPAPLDRGRRHLPGPGRGPLPPPL